MGAGRVGTALALGLRGSGYGVVAVASRSRASAQHLAEHIPGCRLEDEAQAVLEAADVVFLTVSDDAIEPLAATLTGRAGLVVAHCSGAKESSVLEPLRASGTGIGSFHPLQTFPTAEVAIRCLPGSTIAVEGEEDAVRILEELARALGGVPVRLPPGSKPLYHASAILSCGSVVTLFEEAVRLWGTFGYSPQAAQAALLPLLQGTVAALGETTPARALTGPIPRGDVGTVKTHLEALAERAPAALPLYREVSLRAIPLAEEKGTLGPDQAQRLRHLLTRGRE